MKRSTLLAAAAALALPALALPAFAQTSVGDQVTAGLEAQGFGNIEVDTRDGVVKIEGVRGTTKVEFRYDAATGALLEQESYRLEADGAVPDDNVDFVYADDGAYAGGDAYDDNDGDNAYDDNGGDRPRGVSDDVDRDDDDGDRNRGHGNDEDGDDEDNPGRGNGGGSNDDDDRDDSNDRDDRADDDDDEDDDGGRGRGRGRGGDGDDD